MVAFQNPITDQGRVQPNSTRRRASTSAETAGRKRLGGERQKGRDG